MAEAIKGSFRSVTGQKLEKRLWPADGEPKAIVQFVHGMAEHIDRYDAPAKALNQAGFDLPLDALSTEECAQVLLAAIGAKT